jgi:hypothetical protein
VTNGLTVAEVTGLSQGNFVGAPVYGFYYDGYPQNIMALNPSQLAVVWTGSSVPQPVYIPGVTNVTVNVAPNAPILTATFTDANLTLTSTTILTSGGNGGLTTVSAVASAGHTLQALLGALTNLPFATVGVTQTAATAFTLTSFGYGGHIYMTALMGGGTTGTVSPGVPSSSLNLTAKSASAVGNASLGFSFAFAAPQSSNPIKNLPPSFTAPGLWAQWGARWVLLLNDPIATRTAEYLDSEYHTGLFYANSQYLLIQLPSP